MPETITVDSPPVANGAATVSASALALHLDCSRAYIGKLEAEGVIQRQSPRAEADADHLKTKTEMLQLRLMEKSSWCLGRTSMR
jgi:hypothetical protein